MPVKQISVRIENSPGKLSEITDSLGENSVNLIALLATHATDPGRVCLIASDPEKAMNVLKSHQYAIQVTEVLAIEMPSHPGGLKAVLKPLREKGINVFCLYACLGTGENTVLIAEVDRIEEAIQVLQQNWIRLYDEELYTFK